MSSIHPFLKAGAAVLACTALGFAIAQNTPSDQPPPTNSNRTPPNSAPGATDPTAVPPTSPAMPSETDGSRAPDGTTAPASRNRGGTGARNPDGSPGVGTPSNGSSGSTSGADTSTSGTRAPRSDRN